MNKKSISVLFVAIFIIVVGAMVYIATTKDTNQPATFALNIDKTADWQTYTNSEYGFELKMPRDWKAKYEPSNPVIDSLHKGYITFSTQNKGEIFNTLILLITPTKNLKECENTILCFSGEKVGEKNGLTFGFMDGVANSGVDFEYYKKYMEEKFKDNNIVIKTFKFIK